MLRTSFLRYEVVCSITELISWDSKLGIDPTFENRSLIKLSRLISFSISLIGRDLFLLIMKSSPSLNLMVYLIDELFLLP